MDTIVALVIIAVSSIGYLVYVYFDMTKTIELQQRRISEMATMLQIAEYQTERPYYTSLSTDQTKYEYPNWLYKANRDKIKNEIIHGSQAHDSPSHSS